MSKAVPASFSTACDSYADDSTVANLKSFAQSKWPALQWSVFWKKNFPLCGDVDLWRHDVYFKNTESENCSYCWTNSVGMEKHYCNIFWPCVSCNILSFLPCLWITILMIPARRLQNFIAVSLHTVQLTFPNYRSPLISLMFPLYCRARGLWL